MIGDVEQLVLEGGMVPVYVYVFCLCFTYVFHVCNYGSLTCFYAYAFSIIIFGACKYLNVVSFTTLLRVVRFTFMVYFQTTML